MYLTIMNPLMLSNDFKYIAFVVNGSWNGASEVTYVDPNVVPQKIAVAEI